MLFARFGQPLCMAALAIGLFSSTASTARAEQLPASLRGTWRITRILPTTNSGCWTREQAQSLVGTTLTYSQNQMRWRGGVVPLEDIYTRVVSAEDFSKENAGAEPASFAQLGVRAAELTEVDMQHEDAAVLPASTEIPGDSVLMVAPDQIVVSACGVYYEATRGRSLERASLARSGHVRSSGR
ncbi:MAG TPA: hypothetical protein VFA99_11820 [Acidobacteriaceae bacterium]|nr:hypothetical protein [Acidobacteriaceae bacterium]